MLREMMKSKIHRATVTDANLDYVGSLSVDPELLKKADLLPGEKVQVVNVNNGSRLETYIIEGKPGEMCLNGPAARLGLKGDKIIVIAYGYMEDQMAREFKPRIVHVDDNNNPVD